jgi:hypothetical protein
MLRAMSCMWISNSLAEIKAQVTTKEGILVVRKAQTTGRKRSGFYHSWAAGAVLDPCCII